MMTCLFGYMNLLIIVKWLTNYAGKEGLAPSILTTLINMPLKAGEIVGQPFLGSSSFNQGLSVILLLIGIICIPLMLLPKPLILKT